MAHTRGNLLFALVVAAPLAIGCVVGRQGPPPRAAGGWRGSSPPARHVPPGQVRRAEVHERNAARKAEHSQGNGRHGHGHDHD